MHASKRRGRPVGTDYKEDTEALALVADSIVADHGLKPSTAMRAVCMLRKWRGQTDEAITARWLRKWKTQGPAQLESARQRRAAIEAQPVMMRPVQFAMPEITAEVQATMKRSQAEMTAVTEPVRRAMEQIARDLNTLGMRALCEQQRKMAEEFAASPVFKEMQRISAQMKSLPQVHILRNLRGN